MKKYRFKDSGETFVLGETVKLEVLADENLVKQLETSGVVEEVEEFCFEDIVEHLDNRIDSDVELFLGDVAKVNKKALFILLIKEAALVLDDKYKGHIKYSDELWGISMSNYTPFLLSKDKNIIMNANFTKLAAFRCKEDADKAVEVLKPLIDELK